MHTTSLAEPKTADARDARLLLAALQKIAMERLSAALDAVLRRADDYLFDNSGQGGEAGELTALRDLRRARAQVAQHFTHNLLAGFQRLQLGAMPVSGTTELSLLSEDALEEQLATEQLVDSLARKHAAALELLDQRLAVVVERTILASDENPVAPAFLAAALHDALHTVELSTALADRALQVHRARTEHRPDGTLRSPQRQSRRSRRAAAPVADGRAPTRLPGEHGGVDPMARPCARPSKCRPTNRRCSAA